jgi:CheY-like chemotaxis protein
MQTILTVQSEPLLAAFFTRILEKGYTVLKATSAAEALDVCRHCGKIHLLIVDLDLPVVSGIELGSLLRSWMPGLPVILTADALPEDWTEQEKAEFSNLEPASMAVLKLPFSPDDLRTRVAALIGFPETAFRAVA